MSSAGAAALDKLQRAKRRVGYGCHHGRTVHAAATVSWSEPLHTRTHTHTSPSKKAPVRRYSPSSFFPSPGSSEADMLLKICGVMGVPTQSIWAEGMRLAAAISYKFPNVSVTPLSSLVRHASSDALGMPPFFSASPPPVLPFLPAPAFLSARPISSEPPRSHISSPLQTS